MTHSRSEQQKLATKILNLENLKNVAAQLYEARTDIFFFLPSNCLALARASYRWRGGFEFFDNFDIRPLRGGAGRV